MKLVSKPTTAAVIALSLMLGGCTQQPTKQDAGMVIGGVLGGVLGSQVGGGHGRTAAIIVGTLAGAAIGGALGKTMDDVDRMKTAASLETVRTGVPSTWKNPDSGNQYTVTPTRTYEVASGPCREYTIDAVIEGRREKVHGTACRDAEGNWRTQS